MRASFVIILTAMGLVLSFKDAFFGLLIYTWYSFFSPIELTYGALENTRLSFIVASVFILSGVFQNQILYRRSLLTALLFIFIACAFCSLAVTGKYNLNDIFLATNNLNKLIIIGIFSPVVVTSVKKLYCYTLCIAFCLWWLCI